MKPHLLKKGLDGSIHQYISSIVMGLCNFLIVVLIVRSVSVIEFGIYNFILNTFLFASVVTSLGLGPVLLRYLPEYRSQGNNTLLKRLVVSTLMVRLVAGIILVISLFFVFGDSVIALFQLPSYAGNFFFLAAIIILLRLESQLLGDGVLVALMENKYWNLCRVAYSISKIALTYYALESGYGLKGVFLALLGSEILVFILFLLKDYRMVFSLPVKQNDTKKFPVRKFLTIGGHMYFYNIGHIFRDKAADIFIISYFLGPEAVGVYSVAFGIPLMVMMFSPAVMLRSVLVPMIIHKYNESKNVDVIKRYFMFMSRVVFFVMVPIFTCGIILSEKILLYVLNPEYIDAASLFKLSMVFVMIIQFVSVYNTILLVLEKTKIIFIVSFFAVINLVADIILIPVYGVLGAILATGLTGMLTLVYYHFATLKVIKVEFPWKSFAVFSFNTLVVAIMLYAFKGLIVGVLSLAAVVLLASAVYLATSYFNKGFDEFDRETINGAVGKKVWVF